MTSPATPPSQPSSPFTSAMPPSFASTYERVLVGPLFRPWAQLLVESVPLAAGDRVLDVACGTGIVARLALERVGAGGRVVGVDRSPDMLAVARAAAPSVDWRQGDAADPPVRDGERFDAVFCHQGLQFFADRAAAVGAMRRALEPGGHLGIGVWRAVEENGFFADLDRVAERFVGPLADTRHAFGDADALARLLADAGFRDVRVRQVSLATHFELDPAVLARLNAMAVIGMTAKGQAMSEDERESTAAAMVAASVAEAERYREGDAIVFPTSANVATARA